MLKKLAKELGLAKLNFQVLRRTMATLAQKKGGVKDVQSILGHSKADMTVNVYMQQIEERQTDAGRDLSRANGETGGGRDSLKFRTISHGDRVGMSATDRINSSGRLTQR